MPRIDFDAARNKYAVYEGAVSDSKLLNPLSNLASMRWHSDLPYVGIIDTITISVSLKLAAADRVITAHGQSFAPLLLGHVALDGKTVPIQGAFLYDGVAFSVYANTTNIMLHMDSLSPQIRPADGATATFTIHVCNIGFTASGSPVYPATYPKLEITPDRMRCGQFDTNNKHLHADNSGSVVFYEGQSIDIGLGYVTNNNAVRIGIRQDILGYSEAILSAPVSGVGGGFYAGTPGITPSIQRTTAQ